MKRTIECLRGHERLVLVKDLCEGLKKLGIKCDYFTANLIINNLYKTYLEAVERNPSIRQAVLDGNIEFKIKKSSNKE
jgi:hypothetical protein